MRPSSVAPVLLCALLLGTPAVAANASFGTQNVQALIDGGTVSFRAASVVNDSKHATGALRLELWAASQPLGVGGAAAPPMNYKLAQFQLGPLQVGQQFKNVSSPILQLGSPADGTWYYVVFLTEFTGAPTNDGYSVDDWVVMPGTVTIGTPSPPPDTVGVAVEYFYYLWGFYFVTADPAEIAALDSGAFDNVWGRTGETFHVWRSSTAPGSAPTCRFFSDAFAPRSTHVYTPFPAECELLQANPAWTYEGIAFYVTLPDDDGLCPPGTVPLYRAYNNGIGGAPNHRFTIDFATLQQMLAAGWTFEGNGNSHVFACVPQ